MVCRRVHWQTVTVEESLKLGHISWQDTAIILMVFQSLTDCTTNLESWKEKGGKSLLHNLPASRLKEQICIL